jgi:hypothetical protein
MLFCFRICRFLNPPTINFRARSSRRSVLCFSSSLLPGQIRWFGRMVGEVSPLESIKAWFEMAVEEEDSKENKQRGKSSSDDAAGGSQSKSARTPSSLRGNHKRESRRSPRLIDSILTDTAVFRPSGWVRTQYSSRFSLRVEPLYRVRKRPRRCNSGTTRSTNSSKQPGV